MIRRPPRSTRTDTLCPYTTLFRSGKTANLAGAPVGRPRLCQTFVEHRAAHADSADGHPRGKAAPNALYLYRPGDQQPAQCDAGGSLGEGPASLDLLLPFRSEERRVGKEWSSTLRSR